MNQRRALRGGNQGRARAGAGSKISDRQPTTRWLIPEPIRRFEKTFGQKVDVETKVTCILIYLFLRGGQEIHKKRGKSPLLKNACDIPIAWTVAATPAAVREHNDTRCSFRNYEVP